MDGARGLHPRSASTKTAVMSGSKGPASSLRKSKDSFMKRLARKFWPREEADGIGRESSDTEGRFSNSASSSDVAANPKITLGSLLYLVKDLLGNYELGATMLLLDSLAQSALADAELPCSQSDFDYQLVGFLGQHWDESSAKVAGVVHHYCGEQHIAAVNKRVEAVNQHHRHQPHQDSMSKAAFDVVSHYHGEQEKLASGRNERKSYSWKSEARSKSPQRLVVPMRSSALRWCRGTKTVPQTEDFNCVFSVSGPGSGVGSSTGSAGRLKLFKHPPEARARTRRSHTPTSREETRGQVRTSEGPTGCEIVANVEDVRALGNEEQHGFAVSGDLRRPGADRHCDQH